MLGSEGVKKREKASCSYCFWLQQRSCFWVFWFFVCFFKFLSKLCLFIYYNPLNELNIKPIQIFKDRHYVLYLNATSLLFFNCWETFFF